MTNVHVAMQEAINTLREMRAEFYPSACAGNDVCAHLVRQTDRVLRKLDAIRAQWERDAQAVQETERV